MSSINQKEILLTRVGKLLPVGVAVHADIADVRPSFATLDSVTTALVIEPDALDPEFALGLLCSNLYQRIKLASLYVHAELTST